MFLQGRPIHGVQFGPLDMENCYELSVSIPPKAVGFGTYMLLIFQQGSSKVLSRVALSDDDMNGEDLRVEVVKLRAEIDLRKRLFRVSFKSDF